MPLNVSDIIAIPELRTRLLSGGQGLGRTVRWAHVCELADPTQWFGEGDLLMTTGIGIPVAPDEQRRYVERLSGAGLAGLMIGEDMQAPADLVALQQAAEALGFPLLVTHYGVPFAAVTRAIVDAGRQEEFERRNTIARIYESARLSIQGLGLKTLLQRLEKDVQASLKLVEPQSLEPWQPGLASLTPEQRAPLSQYRLETTGNQPVVRRCRLAEGEALVMAVPSLRDCWLIAHGEQLPDYGLLHHLVAVLGIELERLRVECERSLRLGSELLDDLLQQRLSRHQAEERLSQFGKPREQIHLAVARPAPAALAECYETLQRDGVSVLLRAQGEELILLYWGDVAPQLHARLHSALGLSNPLGHPERCLEALREARLALAHTNAQTPLAAYAQVGANSPWLPQSLDEAARVFRQVLGNLADYDSQQGTPMLHTLRVFLAHNRSWLAAAKELHVHKQTLVYRMRRIEEITGRSLDNTEDVAILWFALRAADVAGMQP
ncbi:PucR family transcriptional regulator [Pseudomonas akapageensis]|uniref:PucR family transcriptional regulator n=1 Tax=Pseudomonas akapageensis TaxID=2609961 RepID=UPI001408549C|nr:PucR family transcriptional regulator ligand-binding domain-containing protein [Pseudomonas akapageensis]